MNIFVLHFNTRYNATLYCNSHVVKILLELMQLLCTCHCVLDGEVIEKVNKNGKKLKPTYSKPDERMYKPSHINHPCAIWLRESVHNYNWTFALFEALCDEYTYRYNKVHLTDKKFRSWMGVPPENIPITDKMTPFKMAMPDDYRQFDDETGEPMVVSSYRKYYIWDKQHIAKWKMRSVPNWFEIKVAKEIINSN